MKKAKVLYVSQEIVPFLPETTISQKSRLLPQLANENGREIRVFMPRYGCINERRHQLHEVIRLSGMNLIINDTDHPLIIKVASIPSARIQVYFIDNEEFFQRKCVHHDPEGKFLSDNDERSMFFCKGVLETVKKLGWTPDIIHCHGWMTASMPLYLKKLYHDDPHFVDTKVVFSAYNQDMSEGIDPNFTQKFIFDGVEKKEMEKFSAADIETFNKIGVQYADGVIKGSDSYSEGFEKFLKEYEKPLLDYQSQEDYFSAYNEFYDTILEENSVLAQ
ncbi:MAG TPA: glycogen/starch synthase [Luteibaculaceae bacterium]|nr:glycogen/starch synthase [Luteibaculaceae bacterium]